MKASLANLVALVFLLAFLILTVLLYREVGQNELQWSRKVFLYGAVEAVAFAAAGYLFGKEVNRQRAESAEERADVNEEQAKNGKALAVAIRTEKRAEESDTVLLARASQHGSSLDALVATANELFPPGR